MMQEAREMSQVNFHLFFFLSTGHLKYFSFLAGESTQLFNFTPTLKFDADVFKLLFVGFKKFPYMKKSGLTNLK